MTPAPATSISAGTAHVFVRALGASAHRCAVDSTVLLTLAPLTTTGDLLFPSDSPLPRRPHRVASAGHNAGSRFNPHRRPPFGYAV